MKKFLRIFFLLFIILIVVALAFPFLFKDKIVALVKDEANKQLNAKMDFKDVDLTLISSFPRFTLSLNDFSLAGINEFKGDTLISLKTLVLKLDLMSVIKGENIKIEKIALEVPRIHALVLKNGKANWDIVKPDTSATKEKAASESKFSIALNEFSIKAGSIVYEDRQGAMTAKLNGLDHTLSGDFTQDVFDMKTKTKIGELSLIMDGLKYLSKARLEADIILNMNLGKSMYRLVDNVIRLNALEFGLDGWIAMPGEDIDMDLKFLAKKAGLKEFFSLIPGAYTKDFEAVKTAGVLAFSGYAKGRYNKKLIPAFGIKLKIDNGSVQYPDLPKKIEEITLDLDLKSPDANPDNAITDIRKLHFKIAGNPVDMAMLIKTPVSDASIKGFFKTNIRLDDFRQAMPLEKDDQLRGKFAADIQLDGKMSSIDRGAYDEFNASGWMELSGFDYKSSALPYPLAIASTRMEFTPRQLVLKSFQATAGKSDFSLSGLAYNYLGWFLRDEPLKASFSFESNMLDANELMGPETATAETNTPDTAATELVEIPSNLDVELKTRVKRLLYDVYDIQNISGSVVLAQQTADLKNLSMEMMRGKLELSGKYSTPSQSNAFCAVTMTISNWDIPLSFKSFNTIQKLAPVAEHCAGRFSAILDFNTMIDQSMSPMLNTLNSTGSLSTDAVSLTNYAPFVKLAEAIKVDQLKKADLKDINLSFKITNGDIQITPFDMKFGNHIVTLGGVSSLDQRINYDLKIDLSRKDLGNGANTAMNNLVNAANAKGAKFSLGERIPLRGKITGTVKDPKVETGLREAGQDMLNNLKDQAKEELDKKKKELEDKARAEADKLKAEADRKKQEMEAKARAEADRIKAEAEAKKKELEDKAKKEAEKKKKELEDKAKKEAEKKIKNMFGK